MSSFVSKENRACLYDPFPFLGESDEVAQWSETVGYELHKTGAVYAGFLQIEDLEALAKAISECCNASGDSISVIFEDLDLTDCINLEGFLKGFTVARGIETQRIIATKL